MTKVQDTFGWYGKVPCVGDFVRAGLPSRFIDAWDPWLQQILLSGHAALKDRWQECYLSAPIWRFGLRPGLCGPRAIIGILMPSVDRVGRQFPLCIAAEVSGPICETVEASGQIFEQLEDLALSMLDEGSSIEQLETTLAHIQVPDSPTPTPSPRPDDTANGEQGADAGSVWNAVVDGKTRSFTSHRMPSGGDAAITLFDLHAPLWTSDAQDE